MMILLCLWDETPQDVYTKGAHKFVLSGLLVSEQICLEFLWEAYPLAITSRTSVETQELPGV